MKVLMFAAGRGTRISRYLGENMPKCSVDIGGTRLISYTVDMFQKKGVRDIGIVVGHGHEVVEKLLEGRGVHFFFNPFYDVTNSIASAWFARDFMEGDDLLLMNGDVFMEESLIDMVIGLKTSPVLLSDESRREEADYKFYYEGNVLKKYGKELAGDDISGEYVGVARLDREFVPTFVRRMCEMINTQKHGVWWENTLYSMTAERDIFVHDVGGKFWAEVDYIEDYERILKFRGCDPCELIRK